MSNLRFSDTELDAMTNKPNITAMRIGRTVPYHLQYARLYQDNEALNPHLPGNRPMAAGQEGAET